MKSFRRLMMLLVLAAALAFGDDHRFPMDLHDLELTSKQHKAVEAAMKEYQSSYRRYHRQSEKTQEELGDLFLNPVFDEKTFRTKHMEMVRGSVEIRTRLFARLHAILTPEQKRRYIRHMEEWEIE